MGGWLIAVVVAAVAVMAWWVLRRSAKGASRNDDVTRLDTLTAWPPATTRILTTAERLAYNTLVRAVPGYMVLAQVPLARFLKVPTRYSYSEWLRRLGNQCADLVVCDMATDVLAVVDVQPSADRISERARKRHNRMARSLKAAGIPFHVWTDNALPSVDTAREMIMPAAAAPGATADATGRPDEGAEVREPPPSTWFDEFTTGPAPLPPAKQ